VTTNRWILVITSISAAALGIGLPLGALQARTGTDVITGSVVAIDLGSGVLVIHELTGPAALHGLEVSVLVPPGQQVQSVTGPRPLGSMVAGQQVRAELSTARPYQTRWVRLTP
jgi:hypothetical protein